MLPDAGCDALLKAVSAPEAVRSRAGARHLLSHPAIAELASASRLIGIAREFLGRSAVPFRATLFEKSGRTNWLIPWHQDTALPLTARFESSEWGPWSEKAGHVYAHAPGWALSRVVALRVHLDASTAVTGRCALYLARMLAAYSRMTVCGITSRNIIRWNV